jgi:hypothetical protein
MSNPNYTLDVISHHPTFKNKNLRKYYVDGIETVGAWGDEPFEIRFKNNTWQKIQVKLSIDGTDIFTGARATTEVSDKMWVVNGYDTLSIKAWPETNNGGAAFVFTSANNSVAVHTHGDLSSRGIIAAAVFTEGHVEPIKVAPIVINQPIYPYTYPYVYPYIYGAFWYNYQTDNTADYYGGRGRGTSCAFNGDAGGSLPSVYTIANSVASAGTTMDMDFAEVCESSVASKSLESLAAVGAGQHVDQHISYVAGLIKPLFAESIRVRYLWWDELVSKLRTETAAVPHASGFPADHDKNIDLGSTPKVGSKKGTFRRADQQQQVFSRV